MSTVVDDRHLSLLRVLVSHGVRFVLVGGVALQLRGFSGATRDLDITIATDEINTARLGAALHALNARPYLPGERGTAYHTDLGQLEVMRWTHGVGDYQAWSNHASEIALEPGLTVQVGSASDLLLAKEQAGRDKDADALPRIRSELLASGALDRTEVRGPVAELPADVIPDAPAEELLGRRPVERRARGLWDHGAQLVADYRERWEVPDDGSALGPAAEGGSPQASDRAAVEQQLARLRRLMTRREGGPPDRSA